MPNHNSTFSVCGIKTDANGDSKVVWTTDLTRRIKLFLKQGYTRVDLIDLPREMTKLEALEFIKAHPQFQSAADQATIAEAEAYRMLVQSKRDGTYVPRPRGRPRKNPVNAVVVTTGRGRKVLSIDTIKSRIKADSEVSAVLDAAGITI